MARIAPVSNVPDPFQDRIAAYTARVNERLDAALPPSTTRPERLHEAMRYAVLSGGKRVRPLLVYAAGECLQIDPDLLDAPAVAIELIHAFSLVHDDLPAMDDDDLRRGKPTVHRQYDEATAILAADALQPLAFSVLANKQNVPADAAVKLVRMISDACGSTGMTGGQSIDLDAEGQTLSAADLEHMYALKTGALLYAAVMSATCLRADIGRAEIDALDGFARNLGIVFQIKDDILDIESETAVLGKPVGSDIAMNKATYPSVFGIEASRARCDALLKDALQHIAVLGESAAPLKWLARFIVERRQ